MTAEDAAGNVGAASNQASVTVSTAPPVGLVAAYSFDQGSGTVLTDLSGTGNHGAISGADVDGGRASTAARSRSTASTTSSTCPTRRASISPPQMTLEAWIRPDGARQRMADGVAQGAVEQLRLRAVRQHWHGPTAVSMRSPAAPTVTCAGPSSPALSTWTHLAGTYNGSTLTLYLNGVSIGTLATTGAITTSTGGAEDRRQLALAASGSRATSTRCGSTTARSAPRRSSRT